MYQVYQVSQVCYQVLILWRIEQYRNPEGLLDEEATQVFIVHIFRRRYEVLESSEQLLAHLWSVF